MELTPFVASRKHCCSCWRDVLRKRRKMYHLIITDRTSNSICIVYSSNDDVEIPETKPEISKAHHMHSSPIPLPGYDGFGVAVW